MFPKGKLISVGGAEDKATDAEPGYLQKNNLHFFELGILKRILSEVKGTESRIEVITTASSIPEEVGENYIASFRSLGCNNVDVIHIRNREDAQIKGYTDRVSQADAVFFSGGNQLRLGTMLGGTDFLSCINDRYMNEAGFVIAGTSAGAMAMSNTMIYQGNSATAHLKGEVKITTGLAFISNVIIDSHFDKRGRFNRLAQAVASNPSCTGIGLGEDTGVIITENNMLEVIGSGAVVIVDGRGINYSNIADIPEGTPISIENLRVNILVSGNSYNLKQRQFIADAVHTENA